MILKRAVVDEVGTRIYRLSFDGDDMFFNIAFSSDLHWFNDKVKELTADGYDVVFNFEEVVA